MARDWEQQFRDWAKPPGKTEEDRCNNAISAIKNAIKASDRLKTRNVTVFGQGSYQNNTNVRKDSDVDIGILCTDTFFHGPLPDGLTRESLNILPATYEYEQFKQDVQDALVSYFGPGAVTRGSKAFDVRETSYHVEADVAPFFEHRRYRPNHSYIEGVELQADSGERKVNFPAQHYGNGCRKNTATGSRYKAIVRDLKALSNEMTEKGITDGDIPGFLIECLVWNVPNSKLGSPAYVTDVREALAHIYNNTCDADSCGEWGEVSELLYLFHASQKWTWQEVNRFAGAAWSYVGLGE